MSKTKIQKINADWGDVKNECRNTMNKNPSNIIATEKFIKQILISEHSPIRLIKIKWRWEGIKSWISVHFSRHWLGWDKWISTQRSDRTGINRDSSRQDTPVNMDIEANAQSLINVSRYRLCYQSSKETREYMEDLKCEIGKNEPYLSDCMVPNCIYRMACPEFTPCGYFKKFKEFYKNEDLTDIQNRYDLYNEFFYKNRKRINNEM